MTYASSLSRVYLEDTKEQRDNLHMIRQLQHRETKFKPDNPASKPWNVSTDSENHIDARHLHSYSKVSQQTPLQSHTYQGLGPE